MMAIADAHRPESVLSAQAEQQNGERQRRAEQQRKRTGQQPDIGCRCRRKRKRKNRQLPHGTALPSY